MNQNAVSSDDARMRRLRDNWQQTVQEVRAAAAAAGRDPESIRIIGVTKYVNTATTAALIAAGCADVGESRPQLLFEKATALAEISPPHWHLIGHLQNNKVRRSVQVADTIHSIDGFKLLRRVDSIALELGKRPRVLIEVNISGDVSKHGFAPETLLSGCQELLQVAAVEVRGLMTMAGLHSDLDQARGQFAALRELRDRVAAATGLPLDELSMGMSDDFPAAIAEGATMVRIGSRLFDGVIDAA